MTSNNPLEWHKRYAALERRVAKLELGMQEIDRVIDPEGWIGEAFDVLSSELQTVRDEVGGIRNEISVANAKLDAILQRLTGTSSTEES
jgi:predicted aldo/keto reductase-like oxidoreductase